MEHTTYETMYLDQMRHTAPHLVATIQTAPTLAKLAALSESLRPKLSSYALIMGVKAAVASRYQELTQPKTPHGPR